MSTPLAICRRIAALLAPWLAVLALSACITTAAHHHAADGPHAQCAVCSHGAAPAIAVAGISVPRAPLARAERSVAKAAEAPRLRAGRTALSRAPPLA